MTQIIKPVAQENPVNPMTICYFDYNTESPKRKTGL